MQAGIKTILKAVDEQQLMRTAILFCLASVPWVSVLEYWGSVLQYRGSVLEYPFKLINSSHHPFKIDQVLLFSFLELINSFHFSF